MAGKQPAYSEDELALLSEEERDGLLDPDLLDDDPNAEDVPDDSFAATLEAQKLAEQQAGATATAAAEAKAKEEADAAAEKAATDAKAAADAEAAKVAAAAAAVGADGKPIVAAGEEEQPKPIAHTAAPTWAPPEKAQEKLDDIDRKKDELAQKFDDGEMTATEMRAAMKPLDKEAQTIRDEVFKATIAQDFNKDQYFTQTVPKFMADHKEYADGSPLFAALDNEVRKLQAESPNPFDPAILEAAHKTVRASTLKALGLDPETVKPGAKAVPDPQRVIPPTLRDVPAADITETGTISQFAYLDKLEGVAYETALAKLSEADQERYLSEA